MAAAGGFFVGRWLTSQGKEPRVFFAPSADIQVFAGRVHFADCGGRPKSRPVTASALLELRLLANLEDDAAAYNLVLNAAAEDERRGLPAASLWHRRMTAARAVPDAASFGALIKAAARAREPQEAERWFANMEAARLQGDVVKYGAVIDAYAKGGQPQGAERWLLRLCAARGRSSVNVVAATAAMGAWAASGEVHRIEAWRGRLADTTSGCGDSRGGPLRQAFARAKRVAEATAAAAAAAEQEDRRECRSPWE